jgi:hypothetical protein
MSSANPRSLAAASRLARLLQGFAQEQAMLRLAWRGVSPASLQAIEVDERDLASPAARAAQWAALGKASAEAGRAKGTLAPRDALKVALAVAQHGVFTGRVCRGFDQFGP